MARTKQTARASGRVPIVDSNVVDMPDMDDATAQKLQEIKEGSMQALMKHIDRKHTEKGHVYYTETTEGKFKFVGGSRYGIRNSSLNR